MYVFSEMEARSASKQHSAGRARFASRVWGFTDFFGGLLNMWSAVSAYCTVMYGRDWLLDGLRTGYCTAFIRHGKRQ